MPPPAHQIWGGVESSSCEGSSDSAPAQARRDCAEALRRRKLPLDLQQHLRIYPSTWSSTSESPGSERAADATSARGDASRATAEVVVGSGKDKATRLTWSDEEDDHTSGAASNGTGDEPGDDAADGGGHAYTAATASLDSGACSDRGRPEQEEHRSRSLRLHAEGKCKPCHYMHTKLGCLNGLECLFCHIPHSSKRRPRPCKTKRLQCKRIVNMIETAASKDPQQLAEATKNLAQQSPFLQSVLQTRLQTPPEQEPQAGGDHARVDARAMGAAVGSAHAAAHQASEGAGTKAVANLMVLLRDTASSGEPGHGCPQADRSAALHSESEAFVYQ